MESCVLSPMQGQGCTIIQPPGDGLRVNHVLYCSALSLILPCSTAVCFQMYHLLLTLPFFDILKLQKELFENGLLWISRTLGGGICHMHEHKDKIFTADVQKNYKPVKWVGCAAVRLYGLTASVEGQSDSLSMQPFIMQRLIIISCLLISHWHIAFLNVSTNSPCLPLLPPCAGKPSLHPAHSYDDGSALALNV